MKAHGQRLNGVKTPVDYPAAGAFLDSQAHRRYPGVVERVESFMSFFHPLWDACDL